jgi:hypothetical protein
MGILRALGLGKDPQVEWMIEAFGAKSGEKVVNRLYEGNPELWRWEGDFRGTPITFYASSGNKFRGGGGIYLGQAGPQFMEGVSDYRCYFHLPSEAPTLSIDDPRWAAAVDKAQGDDDWTSSFPEEAFEDGVAVGRFAVVLDCPLDPRPVFAHLSALRGLLQSMSDAVSQVYVYRAGVGFNLVVERLTKEKLVTDAEKGVEMVRLAASMG